MRVSSGGSSLSHLAHAALDRGRKVEREIDRNGVANHLVAIDDAFVAQLVAVWKVWIRAHSRTLSRR